LLQTRFQQARHELVEQHAAETKRPGAGLPGCREPECQSSTGMNLRTIAKRFVVGTPMERPARVLAKVLPKAKDNGDEDDRQTLALMQAAVSAGSSCVDVGCHEGFFLRYMRSAAPAGHHFAFEPIPSFYQQLVREFEDDPKVTISPFALSDESKQTTFHHNQDNPAYSGLLKRRYPRDDNRVEVIDVEMRRLDDLIPHDAQIDFIKIDVEGAELSVLRGARNVVARCRPMVVFEFGTGAADHYGTTPDDIFEYFSGLGYEIWPLADRLAGKAGLTLARLRKEYRTGAHWYFVACGVPQDVPLTKCT
jgi:FkbM family methyltransferase